MRRHAASVESNTVHVAPRSVANEPRAGPARRAWESVHPMPGATSEEAWHATASTCDGPQQSRREDGRAPRGSPRDPSGPNPQRRREVPSTPRVPQMPPGIAFTHQRPKRDGTGSSAFLGKPHENKLAGAHGAPTREPRDGLRHRGTRGIVLHTIPVPTAKKRRGSCAGIGNQCARHCIAV